MKTVKYLAVISFLALLCSPLAMAQSACDPGGLPCVAAGTDYFTTQPGTEFMGMPLMGVPIVGSPVATADTIIQRTSDTIINGPPGMLMITGLNLESTAPMLGDSIVPTPLFVTLDPNSLPLDTGTIDIMDPPGGGTFNSTLDVFFDICLGGDTGTGVGCGAYPIVDEGSLMLSQNGAMWGPNPTPGDALLEGLYSPNTNPFNEHTGLPPNVVDFFVSGNVDETANGDAHVVGPAQVPEPASVILLGTLLLGLGGWKKKNSLNRG